MEESPNHGHLCYTVFKVNFILLTNHDQLASDSGEHQNDKNVQATPAKEKIAKDVQKCSHLQQKT